MTACYEYVSWRKKFAGNRPLSKKDYAAEEALSRQHSAVSSQPKQEHRRCDSGYRAWRGAGALRRRPSVVRMGLRAESKLEFREGLAIRRG